MPAPLPRNLATLGRLVGLLAYNAFPDHRADFEISSYVYLGGVAGLAGATRMTASVVLIAAESAGVRPQREKEKTGQGFWDS
mmetsp:Transcript_38885/g.153755  ORF Transcript_38885/g.153755 Transcript_38885/m.153755 type:complete len:82 (+) Transcript_38885:2146-2391(+)